MSKTLILICHLERLGPSYVQGDDWVDYWLGLNCGYEDAAGILTQADAERLRTWVWSGFSGLLVAGLNADDMPVLIASGDVKLLPVPNGWVTPTVSFTDRLDDAFARSAQAGLDSFVLDAAPAPDQEKLPWTAFLGTTSAWPGGLNDWIHTSIHFRVKKSVNDAFAELIAAPVFSASIPFTNGRSPKALSGLDLGDVNSPLHRATAGLDTVYEWSYEDDDVPLTSRQAQCKTVFDPGNDSAINLATLGPPAGFTYPDASADWTEHLEVALAEVFDLPRLLLSVLRKRLNAGQQWTYDAAFHDLLIASLRDIANLGRSPGADGSTLSQWLLDQIGLSSDDAKLAALDQPDLTAWTVTLTNAIKAVQKTTNFSDDDLRHITDGDRYLASLEQVHGWLQRDEFIAAVISDRYTQALSLDKPAQAGALKKLNSAFTKTVLRKRMLLGALGPAWRVLDFGNVAEFTTEIADAVKRYMKERSSAASATEYGRFYPRIANQPSGIDQWADDAAAVASDLLQTLVIPQPCSGDSPDVAAEGLVIPIGPFRSAPKSAAGDQQDSQRRVGGAGIFLKRDQDAAAWTMLNYARIVDSDGAPLIAKPVPVPLKLQYRNGVSNSQQVYLNAPLAAAAPEQETYVFKEEGLDFPPVFALANPYSSAAQDPKLEGLSYGTAYRVWTHHIGKGGNLPSVVTTHGSADNLPWQLAEPAADAFKNEYQILRFVRRTSVGALRLHKAATGEPQALVFPAIPREIQPLRDSLFPGESKVDPARPRASKPSLVLLAPPVPAIWDAKLAPSTFSFSVRPPSVDRNIWQRWIGFDSSTTDLRAYVREQWLIANANPDKKGNPLAIDDPGVSEIELLSQRIFDPASAPAARRDLLTIPARPPFNAAHPSMDAVQAAPWTFQFVTAASGTTLAPVIDQTAHTVEIAVPEGELWSFRLRPRAKASDKARFHNELWAYIGDDQTDYAHSAYGEVHFMVEVATTWADNVIEDTRTALHTALTPHFEQSTQMLNVRLQPSGLLARLVRRVDLQVQRWRWDGRPVYRIDRLGNPIYGYPFDLDPSGVDYLPADGLLFGGRDSSDHYELSKIVDFVCQPPDSGSLEERNLSTMPGALYYRFAARAYSRYAPWLLRNPFIDTLTIVSHDQTRQERWRRVAVPCRYRGKLPRPVVRLILPLTLAGKGAENANLLVLLDDQWYSDGLAGLAEQLEGEILRVLRPESQSEQRPQFGPDPIVEIDDDPYGAADINLPPAIGAMGYTFDTDTQAPLFTKASFLQPLPDIQVDDAPVNADLSWHFLQLRYRRKLDPSGTENALNGALNVSEWTEPVWVQILPAADRFRVKSSLSVDRRPVGDLRYDAANAKIYHKDDETSTVLPTKSTVSDDGKNAAFTLYALVTRAAPDAFGRAGRESYVDFAPMHGLDKYPAADHESLRVRIVELQHRRDDSIAKADVFDALFPKSDLGDPGFLEDQRARVVRVSPPLKTL